MKSFVILYLSNILNGICKYCILFLKRLNKLIPSLEMDDIVPGRAGVRAMALAPEGEMIDDFKIEKN